MAANLSRKPRKSYPKVKPKLTKKTKPSKPKPQKKPTTKAEELKSIQRRINAIETKFWRKIGGHSA